MTDNYTTEDGKVFLAFTKDKEGKYVTANAAVTIPDWSWFNSGEKRTTSFGAWLQDDTCRTNVNQKLVEAQKRAQNNYR